MMHRQAARRALTIGIALAAVATSASACGGGSNGAAAKAPSATDVSTAGDIPDTQAFITFPSADGTYSLKVPEGWSRSDTPTGSAFTSKFNSVVADMVNAADAPTIASASATEVPAIAAVSHGFKLGKISTVRLPGGEAVLITYRVDSPADPVTGKSLPLDVERYEFAKGGRTVTITLSAPAGSDNVDPWKIITTSFGWQR